MSPRWEAEVGGHGSLNWEAARGRSARPKCEAEVQGRSARPKCKAVEVRGGRPRESEVGGRSGRPKWEAM